MMGKLKGIGDSLLGHFGLSTKNFQFNQQVSSASCSLACDSALTRDVHLHCSLAVATL